MSVIDTATETQTALVTVGNNPGAIGAAPDGQHVYVANTESGIGPGTVSVIDTTTNAVTATVVVGSFPASLAVATTTNPEPINLK